MADADHHEGPVLLVGTRKGAVRPSGRPRPGPPGSSASRSSWATSAQHVVLDPRDRRTPADGRPHRPPRPDGVPVRTTSGAHLDGGLATAGVPHRRARWAARPGLGVLAHARTRRRARRLVRRRHRRRGCSAARTAATTWDAGRRLERPPACGRTWAEWPEQNTPDGSMLHSVNVDPRDPSHLYLGLSGGGVFESTDGGADWAPLNAGCAVAFLPEPEADYGHDPHCVRLHPERPDRLYQQNHCGIYRIDRPEGRVGPHRRQHARRGRRHRLPDGAPPPRPRHGVGLPDGRHRRVAAHEPRRASRRLRHPRRGRIAGHAATSGCRDAGLVHREAPGHDRRRATTRSGCTSAPPAARSGPAPTRASPGTCVAQHLPEIYSVEHADPLPDIR